MTAIDKYIRLEALGNWKETPDADPREVVLSFGDATLLLSDMSENLLAHWALAGMQRVSYRDGVALYTLDSQGYETLEVTDKDMIEAIAKVSRFVAVGSDNIPKSYGIYVSIGVLILGLLMVAPMLIRYQANAMTTTPAARNIGLQLAEEAGMKFCDAPNGRDALDTFLLRTFPTVNIALYIVQDETKSYLFPGDIILMSEADLQLIYSQSDFHEYIEKSQYYSDVSLHSIFKDAPLGELVSYLTTGDFSPELHRQLLEDLMVNQILARPNPSYSQSEAAFLSDVEWRHLQEICLD